MPLPANLANLNLAFPDLSAMSLAGLGALPPPTGALGQSRVSWSLGSVCSGGESFDEGSLMHSKNREMKGVYMKYAEDTKKS